MKQVVILILSCLLALACACQVVEVGRSGWDTKNEGDSTSVGISLKMLGAWMGVLDTAALHRIPPQRMRPAQWAYVFSNDSVYVLDLDSIWQPRFWLGDIGGGGGGGISDVTGTDNYGFHPIVTGVTIKDIQVSTLLQKGSIPFVGTDGALRENNPGLYWDSASGRLGLYTAAPRATEEINGNIYVGDTITTNGDLYHDRVSQYYGVITSPSSSLLQFPQALYVQLETAGSTDFGGGNNSALIAGQSNLKPNASATIDRGGGWQGRIYATSGNDSITFAFGLQGAVDVFTGATMRNRHGAGVVGSMYQEGGNYRADTFAYVESGLDNYWAGGAPNWNEDVGNKFGFFIRDYHTGGNINYGIYQQGITKKNVFESDSTYFPNAPAYASGGFDLMVLNSSTGRMETTGSGGGGIGTVTRVGTIYPLQGGDITSTGDINLDTAAGKWRSEGYNDTKYLQYVDGLIQPGYVTHAGGLSLDVTAALYRINGVLYTSAAGSVTLSAADPTDPRFDVVAVDNTGAIVTITGTPDPNPSIPQIDPDTQVFLAAIYVPAGATDLSTPDEIIYDENTEAWTGAATGVTVNFNSTANPCHLTKSADVGSWTAGQRIDFTKNTGSITITDYTMLKLEIQLKATISGTANVRVSFLNGTTVVSSVITLAAANGFSKTNTTSCQNINVPISAFTFTNTTVTRVRVTLAGAGGGMYLDWVQLQAGTGNTFTETDPVATAKTITVTGSTDVGVTGGTQVLNSNPAFTLGSVTGIRGSSVPSLSTGNLRYNGSAWIFDNASYLTSNQTITWTGSGDVSGSASGTTSITPTLTLATVNSNVGTFNTLTVNAKGLVTAASNTTYLTSADLTGYVNAIAGENYLSKTGSTITANPVDLSGTNATGTLAAGRFPALTGDITTSAGSLATTLATVNSDVGTFNTLTVNAKGLVTAASNTSYLTAAITTLNTLTAATQTFATGTSGSDFNISSVTSTHTFNIPDASATARGLVTTGTQTFAGNKTFSGSLFLSGLTAGNNTTDSLVTINGNQVYKVNMSLASPWLRGVLSGASATANIVQPRTIGDTIVTGGIDVIGVSGTAPLYKFNHSGTFAEFNNGIANTRTDGIVVRNYTAATAGVTVQRSPAFVQSGTGWATGTGVSQRADWSTEVVPVSQSNVSSNLVWAASNNGSPYTNEMTLRSDGLLTTTSTISITSGGTGTLNAGTIQALSGGLTLAAGGATGNLTFKQGGSQIPGQFFGGTGNFIVQGSSGTSITDASAMFYLFRNNVQFGGTFTNTASSTAFTGTSTDLKNYFKLGDSVKATSGTAETTLITAIASATSMTTSTWTNAHTGATFSASATGQYIPFAVKYSGLIGIGLNPDPSTSTGFVNHAAQSTYYAAENFASGPITTTISSGNLDYNNAFYLTNSALNRTGIGGAIADFTADVNNSGTGETDLLTYTTKASTLAATGEKLIFEASGTFNDLTATAQLQFYYGGTNIGNTGALTVSATGGWSARIIVIRTGASTARAMVTVTTPGASTALYTTETDITSLTFTNTQIIKITGTAGGAGGGSSDITAKLGTIFWWPAANN